VSYLPLFYSFIVLGCIMRSTQHTLHSSHFNILINKSSQHILFQVDTNAHSKFILLIPMLILSLYYYTIYVFITMLSLHSTLSSKSQLRNSSMDHLTKFGRLERYTFNLMDRLTKFVNSERLDPQHKTNVSFL
jgi:hypothetical protein